MKRLLFTIALLLTVTMLKAQIETPVKWAYAAKKINKTEAIVMLKATIDEGWHLYAQNMADGGPVKTSFTFTKDKKYQLVGKTIEPKPITKFEKAFRMNVSYFEQSVIFQQKVKLMGSGPVTVKGSVEFMVCNDEKCLPPDNVEFSVVIK